MELAVDLDLLAKLGAVYGAVQGIAQVVMLFASRNTVAWRIAKYLTAGAQRPAPTPQ